LYGYKNRPPIAIAAALYLLLILLYLHSRGKLKSQTYRETETSDVRKLNQKILSSPGEEEEQTVELDTEEVKMIEKAFKKADLDLNGQISMPELKMEIHRKTGEHILKSMRNNMRQFFSLDKKKKNGMVDWEEYYEYYVRTWLGLSDDAIKLLEKSPKSVPRYIKESISRMKAGWSEVARTNPEALNIDEFLSLEHPESSMSLLLVEVEQLLNKYDVDGDGKLTRSEFTQDEFTDLDPEEISEREQEFDLALDKDKNGVAERREMIGHLDPKNKFWASQEAAKLMKAADLDHNNHLSMQELMKQPLMFLESKLVDAQLAFHPEL